MANKSNYFPRSSHFKTFRSSGSSSQRYNVDSYHLAGFPPAVTYIALKTEKPCYYAYSQRKVEEKKDETGKIIKIAIFEHKGFFLYDNILELEIEKAEDKIINSVLIEKLY